MPAAIVEGLSKSLIIGIDVLEKARAQLDIRTKTLTMGGKYKIPIKITSNEALNIEMGPKNGDTLTFPLQAKSTYEIPGRSRIIIKAEAPAGAWEKLGGKGIALITENETTDEAPFFVVDTAMELKEHPKEILTPIVNLSPYPITIEEGQKIAIIQKNEEMEEMIFEQVDEKATTEINNVNKPTKNQVPDVNLNDTDLTENQKKEVRTLLAKYADCFEDKLSKSGQLKGFEATIPLVAGTKPSYQKDYRRPPKEHEMIKRDVEKMRDQGVVEPSTSPWSSPPVYAPKKTGELRFCINYKQVNKAMAGDVFPLPRIDDMFDAVHNASYFSLLDATQGYWQIPLKKEDRPIGAFSTREGLFQPTVLQFGFKNAPATWQRAMNTIFSGLLWKHCLIYIDDLLIYSKNFADHLHSLELCLERARKCNLKLRPAKCELFRRKIEFLGHEISGRGIHASPKKIRAISEIAIPNSAKQALSFISLASYYRKFVKGFAEIARPIHTAIHEEPWKWTEQCQEAFEELKKQLTSPPILAHPDFSKPFFLECDASLFQIGLILSQNDEEGRSRVVYYASRLLSAPERNYSATERECLAVLEGVRTFRPYLYGNRFKILTDHNALVWLQNHKDQNSKLMRWFLELQEYDFVIEHRPGKQSQNVDALSRLPHNDDKAETNSYFNNIETEKARLKEIMEEQQRDTHYRSIILYLTKKDLPTKKELAIRIVAESQHMEVDNGILYHLWSPQDRKLKSEV